MTAGRPDVAVLGGGVNGMVAALRAARSDRRVVLVEGAERLGGLARADEIHPGFASLGALPDTGGLRPGLVETLDLARHGLEWEEAPSPALYLAGDTPPAPLEEGPEPSGDAAPWRLPEAAAALRALLDGPPPPVDPDGAGDLLTLVLHGLRLRRLGRDAMLRTLRALPMPAADWLRGAGLDEAAATAICVPALLGTFLGPHSGGSAACVLLRAAVRGRSVRGGAPALAAVLAAACREAGVEIRAGAPVARLETGRDGVSGVTLASGETLRARRVLATCDPRRAMLELLDPGLLDVGLRRRLRAFRCRGTAATLDLALAEPLTVEGEAVGRLAVGPATLDGLERAFDAVKYGEASSTPVMDLWQRVLDDGRAVVSGVVGWVPAAGDEAEARRRRVEEATLAALEERLPGARGRVLAARVRSPDDLAADLGLPGGHLHHGEHALDQLLFMRPTPELARYRTPIRGLYLGGAGSHPGGGHSGMPGYLAAEALLADDG